MAFSGSSRLISRVAGQRLPWGAFPGWGRVLLVLTLTTGWQSWCQAQNHTDAPVATESILIHCPGIAGPMPIDQSLVEGLIQSRIASRARVFDWTGEYRGLLALGKLDHNRQQATVLAREIETIYQNNPNTRVVLTAHSGGTGIAVWALEHLPDTMQIDTLILLASALSPTYDLGPALKHVRQAYSFYSPYDNWVLGTGTRTMGTIDRVKTDAAGYVGFRCKDPKLKQIGYDPRWIKLGHSGDHVGMMDRRFARQILAPLILNTSSAETLLSPSPITLPTTNPSPTG